MAVATSRQPYVQEAAKLDGGKLPDIGLVCLKESLQALQEHPSQHAFFPS
jgi:hypothetical protein